LEIQALKKVYKRSDQMVLIVMIFALPIFGMIYLYHSSGNLDWDLPKFQDWVNQLLVFAGVLLLFAQIFLFQKKIAAINPRSDLLIKLTQYSTATKQRYLILLGVSLICSLGLLLFQSAIYNLLFALTLLFFSLGKPNPNRINKALKLNEGDIEKIRLASRPD